MGLILPPNQNNSLINFDLSEEMQQALYDVMIQTAQRLGHVEWDDASGDWIAKPGQTLTQRNFWPAFKAFYFFGKDWLGEDYPLPTKLALEEWRDHMVRGELHQTSGEPFSPSTIKTRLSHMRGLLRGMISAVQNPGVLLLLKVWQEVSDPKGIVKADKVETDFGHRLNRFELEAYIQTPSKKTLLGLRDRLILSLAGGAGMRLSDIHGLSIADLMDSVDDKGERVILIRKGKHSKQRFVLLNGWNSWLIGVAKRYYEVAGLNYVEHMDEPALRGVRLVKGDVYEDTGERLSTRQLGEAIRRYPATYKGRPITLEPHDLRRTYAKICISTGMSWQALARQLGHNSVTQTEEYVGREVDNSDRIPNWSLDPGDDVR